MLYTPAPKRSFLDGGSVHRLLIIVGVAGALLVAGLLAAMVFVSNPFAGSYSTLGSLVQTSAGVVTGDAGAGAGAGGGAGLQALQSQNEELRREVGRLNAKFSDIMARVDRLNEQLKGTASAADARKQIGRASCRERV